MWGISYWIFPVIAGSCWLSMLLGLLLHWISRGRPHYVSMDSSQKIAYISDIGADSLKPLFIAGCAATTVFLNLSFFSERLLRHNGRLIRNSSTFQNVLVWLSIAFSCMGSMGLILLSVYDTISHPELHDIFLALFISGYIISAFMICCEYQRLAYQNHEYRILGASFWLKLAFTVIELFVAIAFAYVSRIKNFNEAAIIEWTLAFIFTLYVYSFFLDLVPAVRRGSRIACGRGAHGEVVGIRIANRPGVNALKIRLQENLARDNQAETGTL